MVLRAQSSFWRDDIGGRLDLPSHYKWFAIKRLNLQCFIAFRNTKNLGKRKFIAQAARKNFGEECIMTDGCFWSPEVGKAVEANACRHQDCVCWLPNSRLTHMPLWCIIFCTFHFSGLKLPLFFVSCWVSFVPAEIEFLQLSNNPLRISWSWAKESMGL